MQDVAIWTEQGQSADEIVAEFPQLSLSAVYSALAYCHNHRDEIERQVREGEELAERMESESGTNGRG